MTMEECGYESDSREQEFDRRRWMYFRGEITREEFLEDLKSINEYRMQQRLKEDA